MDLKTNTLLTKITHIITDLAQMLLETRLDTWLPQSRVGGQGLYLRSLDHLGRSIEAKDRKTPKKVKCDGRTDRPIDATSKQDLIFLITFFREFSCLSHV